MNTVGAEGLAGRSIALPVERPSSPKRIQETPVPGDQSMPFSLVAGGPFNQVLARLGLLGKAGVPSLKAAVFLALLAWLPPASLAVSQSLFFENYSGWGYFRDATVYTRYLVAILVMMATEKFADERISILIRHFPDAHLLAPGARSHFTTIVEAADRRSSSGMVEGILVLLAVAWSWSSFWLVSSISSGGWEEVMLQGRSSLSWAGTAAELLSNPIFLFLMTRWLWRFLVWSVLLMRISRSPLQLTAIHPDRAGGLAFLSIFPGVFSGLVFALSCVVASSLIKTIRLLDPEQTLIWLAIFGWVLLMAVVFLLPLLVFMRPLYRVREQAIIEYGRLAQLHHLSFHAYWMEQDHKSSDLLGSAHVSSAADLNACVETALNMRIVPLSLVAVLQTLVAAAAPFLVVVATQVPMAEIVKWFIGAIF